MSVSENSQSATLSSTLLPPAWKGRKMPKNKVLKGITMLGIITVGLLGLLVLSLVMLLR